MASVVDAAASAAPKRWEAFHQTHIPAPVSKVWEVVSDFSNRNQWLPVRVTMHTEGDSQKPGAVRYVVGSTGRYAYEKLLKLDEEKHEFVYTVLENTLHLVDYFAEVSVVEGGEPGTSTLTWLSSTAPSEGTTEELFKQLFSGVYLTGIDRLLKLVRPDGAHAQLEAAPPPASTS